MKKIALISLFIISILLILPSKVLATQAQLGCSPTSSTVSVGQTITTDIILNTRGYQIVGADPVLTYTTGVLDTSNSSVVPITTNTNWTNPINKIVDTTLGKIEIDYGSSQSAYTASGSIGKITFTAKQPGSANVNFVFFQEYDTTSTGVSKAWGQRNPPTVSNVLTDVTNCAYTVTGEASTPSAVPTVLPRTGNAEMTMVFIGIGGLLLFAGLVLPKILIGRS